DVPRGDPDDRGDQVNRVHIDQQQPGVDRDGCAVLREPHGTGGGGDRERVVDAGHAEAGGGGGGGEGGGGGTRAGGHPGADGPAAPVPGAEGDRGGGPVEPVGHEAQPVAGAEQQGGTHAHGAHGSPGGSGVQRILPRAVAAVQARDRDAVHGPRV